MKLTNASGSDCLALWQAAYAVLGWILTPLTILTLTGILRQHIER